MAEQWTPRASGTPPRGFGGGNRGLGGPPVRGGPSGGGPPPAGGPPRQGPPPGGLPDGYLRFGYFDDDGYLRPELIVDQAKEIAQRMAGANLTAAAMRRFFGKARKIESRLDSGASFAEVRNGILELKPFAAYNRTREVIPALFQDFIDRNVEQAVNGEREFRRGFLQHFQYVVAYFPKK